MCYKTRNEQKARIKKGKYVLEVEMLKEMMF